MKALLVFLVCSLPVMAAPKAKAGALPEPEPQTPWMGVLIKDSYRGAWVTRVYSGTPASGAGIKQGDIIVAVNRQRVRGVRQTVKNIHKYKVGDTVLIHFSRGRRLLAQRLQLVKRPKVLKRPAESKYLRIR